MGGGVEDEDGRPKEPERLGKTPAAEPLTIPAGVEWYVLPSVNVRMRAMAAEMKAKDIPGVRLSILTTNRDLARFKGITHMRWLDLDRSQVTDAGLSHLRDMNEMQVLRLSGWGVLQSESQGISNAGLVHIRGMAEMRELWLSRTKVTDAGLEHLRGMTEMRELWLSGTQVTDAGLEHLRGMAELRWLGLGGTQVTDAGLEHL